MKKIKQLTIFLFLMILFINIGHSNISSAEYNEFRVIISSEYQNLVYYYYPKVPKITIYYNGVKVGPLYLDPKNKKSILKLKKILASLNINNPDLSFFKIQTSKLTPDCDPQYVFGSDNITKLNDDMLKIERRLLSEQNPENKNYSAIEQIGNTFGLFFNIASFIPSKLFEYTVVAGGWELLSDDAKKEKIEDAIVDGVLDNDSLTEQLAEDYLRCKKSLPKDRDTKFDKKRCHHALAKLRTLAKKFSKRYFKDFDSMNFENMDKVAKKVRVFLLSEISLKNLRNSSFPKYTPLNLNQKNILRKSAALVVSDYNTCLSKAADDFMVNSCDTKIAISAPFRIAKEVLETKLDQTLSCKVDQNEYPLIKETAKKQFDSCSEDQYFFVLDQIKAKEIEEAKEDKGKKEKEKLDSSNIMKACVFSSMLESVKLVADAKVSKSVKDQLKGIKIPENMSFKAKENLNKCFEDNKLIKNGSNNYDFNSLLKLKSDGLKQIIGNCTNELTKQTGADLFKLSLQNNKKISDNFYGSKKDDLVSDIMKRGYEDCLTQYDEPDPAKCKGAAQLIATHKIMEVTLKRNAVENTLSDDEKLKLEAIDKRIKKSNLKPVVRIIFLDDIAQRKQGEIAQLFGPTKGILNRCINIINESVKEKIRMKKLFISVTRSCKLNEAMNCTEEKITPKLCENHNTDFDEADASYCLKQSIKTLSGSLSKVIIKNEIEKNEKLKELGVKFTTRDMKNFEKTASSCYEKLLNCNKEELEENKNQEIKDITCHDDGESLNEVQAKISTIDKRCKNQVYLAVLPEASRKIIDKELGSRISDWRIKGLERRISFLAKRKSKGDNIEIEYLQDQINEINAELKLKRLEISQNLVKDFKNKIKNENNLEAMLKHTDELTNKASLKIIDTIVEDALDEATDGKKDKYGYSSLKESINNEVLNDDFQKSFLSIKSEANRDARIKEVRLKLVDRISSYSITNSLNQNIPDALGVSYRKNMINNIKDVFKNCIGSDPDMAAECGNTATISATGRIYKRTIGKELKALLKSNEKQFTKGPLDYISEASRYILESLDGPSVKKIERKNFHFVANCLGEIDKKLPAIEFSEKSKSCINLGLLDLSSHAIDMYLKKYDSLLSKKERKNAKEKHNECLNKIKSDIHTLSFGDQKQTLLSTRASFGSNKDVDTQLVKTKMTKCSEEFAKVLKDSVFTSVLGYLYINDAVSVFNKIKNW